MHWLGNHKTLVYDGWLKTYKKNDFVQISMGQVPVSMGQISGSRSVELELSRSQSVEAWSCSWT